LSYLSELTVRDGFERYGATAYFDQHARPTAIWWAHGQTLVKPGDAQWAHASWVFRSSVLTAITLVDHLAATHLVIAGGLVAASRDNLPAHHPLRRLLKPFTYRTIAVNRAAGPLLVQELSLLHRTVALDATGLQKGFSDAFNLTKATFDPGNGERFLHYPLLPTSDQHAGISAFAHDARIYRTLVRGFVQSYIELYYEDDDALAHDPHVGAFWSALAATFAQIPSGPLTSRALLIETLTGFVLHVSAGHKHVGAAYPLVKDPRYCASKIRPGREMADAQAAVQVLAISLVTGFKQPMLLDDYSHVLLADQKRNATTALFATFQSELGDLAHAVDARNAARRFKVEAFNPRHLSPSVSI